MDEVKRFPAVVAGVENRDDEEVLAGVAAKREFPIPDEDDNGAPEVCGAFDTPGAPVLANNPAT